MIDIAYGYSCSVTYAVCTVSFAAVVWPVVHRIWKPVLAIRRCNGKQVWNAAVRSIVTHLSTAPPSVLTQMIVHGN